VNAVIQHSSESNEHYTPRAIVEAARGVMGEIDFDPFSCASANRIVQARSFCAPPQDGFLCEWSFEGKPSRVFCNPPGGKLDRKTLKPVTNKGPGFSSAAVGWAKLMHEYEAGHVQQAVFVGFNLELLRTSQGFEGIRGAGEFPLCFPKSRLCFWNEGKDEEHSDPTCANVIVYVPPRVELGVTGDTHARERFRLLFSPLGTVKL
jgi:hypothetical protein